jgi:SAM-dependent methyltransferase
MLIQKEALLRELRDQADFPTAGDPYIHAFFKSLLSPSPESGQLLDLLAEAQVERNKNKHFLTKAHAVYLPVHVINYLMIFRENKPDYPYRNEYNLLESTGWTGLIGYLLGKYRDIFKTMLYENDVQQNIKQRGITIPFLVKTLIKRDGLTVADLGCSANFIWGSLIAGSGFEPVEDRTGWNGKQAIIENASTFPVSVKEMHGIDHRYPLKNTEGKKWLLSCRHPKEVKPELLDKTRKLIEAYEHLPHIKITEGDFIAPGLAKNSYDIVTMNNTLYQLPDAERDTAMNEAYALLKTDGIFVIQDNCEVAGESPRKVVFTDSRKPFTYRSCIGGPLILKTFGMEWLELLRFKSTRCREIEEGTHFKDYMKTLGIT